METTNDQDDIRRDKRINLKTRFLTNFGVAFVTLAVAAMAFRIPVVSAAPTSTPVPAPSIGATFNAERLPVINPANVAQLQSIGQYGRRGEIRDVAISPRNNFLVVSGSLGSWLYNLARIYVSPVHLSDDPTSTSAAISRDGTVAAVASADGSIQLDQLTKANVSKIKTLTGHSGEINALAFSPTGDRLASVGTDKTIRLWSITQNVDAVVLNGHTDVVTSVAFSPDGTILASASADKTVRLWNLVTNQTDFVLSGHTDTVTSVVFSPDGKTLASASADKTVRLWDVTTGQLLLTLTGATEGETAVAFSSDGKTVAAPGLGVVQRWQVADGKALPPLKYPNKLLIGAVFTFDNQFYSVDRLDNMITGWDATTGNFTQGAFYGDTMQGFAFSPDNQSIAIVTNTEASIRTIATGQTAVTWADMSIPIAFSPDGKTIASTTHKSGTYVRLTNITSGQVTELGQVQTLGVNFAFSPDGKLLAFEDSQGIIVLWDTSTGQVITHLKGHTNYLTSMAFSPDGKQLVSADQDGNVFLWDVAKQQLISTIAVKAGYAKIVFSPDGKTIAYADGKNNLKLWDIASQQAIGTIDQVYHYAFSPDGQLIASVNKTGTISLWRTSDRSLIRSVPDPLSAERDIEFSPDGKLIAIRDDHTIRLWAISTELLPTANALAAASAMPTTLSPPTITTTVGTPQPSTTTGGTAANGPQTIAYETPVQGEITANTPQISYVITGTKNDVVEILITATSPKGEHTAFLPQLVVKDGSGKVIVDSGLSGYKGVLSGSTDSLGVTTYHLTYFFLIPQDGPAMFTLSASDQAVGTLAIVLHHVPMVTMDTLVSNQIDYKMLAANTPATVYAMSSSDPFSLEYRTSGALNVTVQVGRLQPNGELLPLGLLGGQSPDHFSPRANRNFDGGSLLVKDPGPFFIISLGNQLVDYDDPQAFFVKGQDTDSAQYQFTIHKTPDNAVPATSAPPPSTPVSTRLSTPPSALTSTANAAPNNSAPQPIGYDTTAHGEITTDAPLLSYVVAGTENDVIEALVTAVNPKDAKALLQPRIRVKDASGASVIDSANSGYSTAMDGSIAASGETIYYGNFFFAIPHDGPLFIALSPNQEGAIGTFDIVLHRLPLLTLDTAVNGQIDYKTLSTNSPGVVYALKASSRFSLDYHVTGALNVTAQVNQMLNNGSTVPIGFLGGISPDHFSPKANSGFAGGSLLVNNANPFYVVSLGNNLADFDDPQTFFTRGKDQDTAQYQLAFHNYTDSSTATMTPTVITSATPTVTALATTVNTLAATSQVSATPIPTIAPPISVVTATATPAAVSTIGVTPAPTQPSTLAPSTCPSARPSRLAVGIYGVVATAANGKATLPVQLHTQADSGSLPLVSIDDGSEFLVIGGPTCANGLNWWQVTTRDNIVGWLIEQDQNGYFVDPVTGYPPTVPITPVAVSCPNAPTTQLAVNMLVVVAPVASGQPTITHLRATPTTQAQIVVNLVPGNQLIVTDGPQCADGYIWWQIRSANNFVGWVAEGDKSGSFIVPIMPISAPTTIPLASEGLLAVNSASGILLVSPNSTENTPVAINEQANNQLAWSSDGQQLIYIQGTNTLCRVNVPAAVGTADNHTCFNLQTPSTTGQIDGLALSPDNTTIALSLRVSGPDKSRYYSQLYVANADGTNLKALTDGTFGDLGPSFTPDSKHIIFNRASRSFSNGINHIYAISVDGSGLGEIKMGVSEPDEPAVSPNGKYLAVASQTSIGAIYVIDLSTGQLRQVTRTAADTRKIGGDSCGTTLDQHPSWSADGAYIAFLALNNCTTDLYVVSSNGGPTQPILTGKKLGLGIAWQPLVTVASVVPTVPAANQVPPTVIPAFLPPLSVVTATTVAPTSVPTMTASVPLLPTPPAVARGTLIQVWLVGDPNGRIPSAVLSSDFVQKLGQLGLHTAVYTYSADTFPQALITALQNNTPPDIVAGLNFGPFSTVLQNPVANARLMNIDFSLNIITNSFGWAVKDSPNFNAVLALLLQRPNCNPQWAGASTLPADDVNTAISLVQESMAAYVGSNELALQQLADPSWYPTSWNASDKAQLYSVHACAMWGNSQLLFVPTVSSYLGPKALGPITTLITLHKVNAIWRLLSITNDSLLLNVKAMSSIARLGKSLKTIPPQITTTAPQPAQLISPADGQKPVPATGQSFGSFSWLPSVTKNIVGEIAEFNYGFAARLFVVFPGASALVSDSQLITTQSRWHWRVWSISNYGDVAFTEVRSLSH